MIDRCFQNWVIGPPSNYCLNGEDHDYQHIQTSGFKVLPLNFQTPMAKADEADTG